MNVKNLYFFVFLIFTIGVSKVHGQIVFSHGVASGDPMPDRVIIWTRVLPSDSKARVTVSWQMATDSSFANPVQTGEVFTSAEKDFTVKVDVPDLTPDTRYYYRFLTGGKTSPTGFTHTSPKGDISQLKFAVVSCNNYEHGYFAAYRHIAHRGDLHAVLHLGDYIYESYSGGREPNTLKDRRHEPPKEILTLSDYRQRYAQYRQDPDLQEAHRVHPFIAVWDDHESSNNSHQTGASGHNPAREGDWSTRLENARQAYFEWMPIRDYPGQKIYRKISYGSLADLIMIDTRIEGRDSQIYDINRKELSAENRSILGQEQLTWLLENLGASQARWKILGNQVIFSPLYAAHVSPKVENLMLDIWDGYPAERLKITQFLRDNPIENLVIVTGDFHVSMAYDVPVDDWNYPLTETGPEYDPQTGKGAVAVEFATPSISSGNFDEFAKAVKIARYTGLATPGVRWLEGKLGKDYRRNREFPEKKQPVNPHLKFINLRDHGYFVLTLTEAEARADYYFLDNVRKKDSEETFHAGFFTRSGENHLERE
ncbi:MAG: alkaline phosphatase D family protein [Bacteroidia bacterium]|nr:alkaline phosphatase D family protein [Bacteroidia bacterium]